MSWSVVDRFLPDLQRIPVVGLHWLSMCRRNPKGFSKHLLEYKPHIPLFLLYWPYQVG